MKTPQTVTRLFRTIIFCAACVLALSSAAQRPTQYLRSDSVMLRITAGGPVALSEAEVRSLLDGLSGVKLTWYALDTVPEQADAVDYDFWDALEDTSVCVVTPDYRENSA